MKTKTFHTVYKYLTYKIFAGIVDFFIQYYFIIS